MVRKAFPGSPILVIEGDTVALDPAAVEVDVVGLERCVADRTPPALEEAAVLYQGDLLAGVAVSEPAFEEWLSIERERLRELMAAPPRAGTG
jgi:DNA-binding SARP family transcriptional activator